MPDDFASTLDNLIREAPNAWLTSACIALRDLPATATVEFVLQRLPSTNNADLSFLVAAAVRHAPGKLSWEALSWALQVTHASYQRNQVERRTELLWSGPSPDSAIPARRIDQTLYDLISAANNEILLVTFAAAKIERLTGELKKAIQRGVKVRLVLEFSETSEGQLTFDALKAFPSELIASAEIFHWPASKRERNQAGRPGKLHAKFAIVDGVALVTSANLTDDAFNRNLELGVLVHDPRFVSNVRSHVDSLVVDGFFQITQKGI